jgi:Ca2+-binding RTX toxin-like protein
MVEAKQMDSRGSDTVDYSALSNASGIKVKLNDTGISNVDVASSASDHQLINIENIIGSSGTDTIEGDSANNILNGLSGTNDTLSYANSTNGVYVNIGTTAISGIDIDGDGDIDDIGSSTGTGTGLGVDTVTNFDDILGGNASDTLVGDANSNTLNGGAGDDILVGAGGADSLIGGTGNDTVSYATDSAGINVSLRNGSGTDGSGSTDNYDSIENVLGSSSNDTIEGDSGNNILNGGAGTDTLTYESSSTGVTVNLSITSQQNTVNEGLDTISNFENLTGSLGSDSLTGDDNVNVINGKSGNDYIVGGKGADSLYGDVGNDTFIINDGDGNDIINGYLDRQSDGSTDGSSSSDTVDFSSLSNKISVDLATNNNAIISDATNTTLATLSLTNIENIIGTNQDDILIGNTEINTLVGGKGNDTITGNDGADKLEGNDGDDTFKGSSFTSSVIDGGTGSETNGDTVNYQDITSSVTVKLAEPGSITTVQVGTNTSDHTIANIENITGSNTAADNLTGNSGKNTILGLIGNDTLDGANGDDYLDGGTGINTLSFASVSSGMNVNLSSSAYTYGTTTVASNTAISKATDTDSNGTNDTDTILNFSNIIGSSSADLIIGDANANTIDGADSDDIIDGLGGADNLSGGAGNDLFIMNADDGADTVDGGSGSEDTISYANLDSTQGISVTLDGTTSKTVTITNGTNDSIKNIENVTGGAGNDTIIGDGFNNILIGNSGNDSIEGGAAKDTLYGGVGIDTLKGDDGEDTIFGGVDKDIINGGAGNDILYGGDKSLSEADVDTDETGTGNDTIYGDAGVDIIYGRDGDDTLDGGTENDTLYGGAGNDTLIGGDGDDTIDGGEGSETTGDTVDYSSKSTYIDVNLMNQNASGYATATIGAEKDLLKNIENITGTTGTDYIGGDNDNNVINGFQGDDIIAGAGGSDTLLGGDGDDTFKAGLDANGDNTYEDGDDGIDYIDGGEGVEDNGGDTVDYSAFGSTHNITVDLSITDSGNSDYTTVSVNSGSNDYIKNIENIKGSAGADIISGDSSNNILDGSAGNDTLSGGEGNDTIIGGTGIDTVTYITSTSGITVDLKDTDLDGYEVSSDGLNGKDDLSGIEVLIASNNDDNLIGSDGNDTLIGAGGNDTISGGLGADDLRGYGLSTGTDSHLDTVSYAYVGSLNSVTVDLSAGSGLVTVGTDTSDTDTLTGFENVIGGAGADNITGSSVANIIKAGSGADIITGGAGADDLQGEAGNDTFKATSATDGADIIDGGIDSDTVDYSVLGSSNKITVTLGNEGTSASVFVTSGDTDSVVNIENIIGTQGNDTITGNSSANTLYGGTGGDTLKGAAGDDELYGEAGNDTLSGGTGDDIIDGGADTDTVDYSNATAAITVDLDLNDGTTSQNVGASEGNDTLNSIENAIGSSFDDTFKTNYTVNNNFNGALGSDTVDYSSLVVNDATLDKVVATMSGATATGSSGSTATSTTDTFTSIENIKASAGNDTLTGDSNANTLNGEAGDDFLYGAGGNDYIDGGTNTAVGDTVNYSSSSDGVTVDLSSGLAQNVSASQGNDTLIDIENVLGSAYADTFKGNNAVSNIFNGGTSNLDAALNSTTGEFTSDESDTVDYSSSTSSIVVNLNANNVVIGGTVTDYLYNIEHVIGTAQDDTFTGNSDNNSLVGGAGNDTFYIIDVNNGNDVIEGDTSAGNVGLRDTIDYSAISNTYYLDADLSSNTLVIKQTSDSTSVDSDTVNNIEDIVGTAGKDIIRGNDSKNILSGAEGTDTIYGEAGNDVIYGGNNTDNSTTATTYELLDGGAGDDTIYGGAGNDSILGGSDAGLDTLYGEAGNDIIEGGSGVDTIDGGTGDDTIKGDSGEDLIYGGLGADTIRGGSEADIIHGGDSLNSSTDGDDIIYGEDGADTIYGGYGNDTISGGANDDTIYGGIIGNTDYDNSIYGDADTVTYESATNGVTVDFVNNQATGEGTDTLYGIENAIGSTYDDTFISKLTVSNKFDGNEGNETNGDSISYEEVNVDSGEETLDKVIMNLSGTADADGYYAAEIYQNGILVTTDYLKNIENITGSNGNDILTGDSDKNTLKGLAGDDTLSGQGGNDYLDGGDGSDTASYVEKTVAVTVDFKTNEASTATETDTLNSIENAIGGSAKDTFIMNEDNVTNIIDGQGDSDTVSYVNYTTNGVRINLSTTNAQTITTGDIDTITNIENIIGSSKDDIFIGSSQSNSIEGGLGNDTFIAGTDLTNDGSIESVDDGADYFDGGLGTGDWADYSVIADDANSSTNGITLALDSATEALVTVNGQTGVDTLLNVENISGTQDNDNIKGDSQNNILLGNAGDDTLYGEGGIDNLLGGLGKDILNGGAGDDTLQGGDGDDSLTGGLGNDKIYGGTLVGTTHTDSGIDTVDFTNALETLTIDLDLSLSGGLATDGSIEGKSVGSEGEQGQGIDELYGIENIIGSNFDNDTIYANNSVNILTTQAGDDVIEARGAADTIYAGSGNDTIIATSASDGADYIDGSTGTDTLDYSALGSSNNITVDLSTAATVDFDGTGGNDSWQVNIASGDTDIVKGIENIIGGAGNDIITGNASVNELQGGAGKDTLSGGDGKDIINGYYTDQSESSVEYDTVSYSYLTSKAVAIDLTAGTAVVDSNDSDTLISIENAIGGSLADIITGSADINSLEGGAGNDTFISSLGNDYIYGGNVTGITHTDSQTTGDMADYSNSINSSNNLVVNLSTTSSDAAGNSYSSAYVRLSSNNSSVYTDSLYGIEDITGTSNNDTLTGSNSANTLIGNAGNDTLQGLLGADKLDGGAGDDVFIINESDIGDSGNDSIIGGSGSDTINYNGITTSGVTIDFGSGTSATVTIGSYTHTLEEVENIIGTNQADNLTGNESVNTIQGMGGDDSIYGQAGSDYLYGGNNQADATSSGDDYIDGKEGDDKIYGGDGKDTLYGGDGKDTLYGEAGDDSINGEAGDDTLFGGAGNDALDGGLGADIIYAGDGDDTITFEQADNKNDIVYGGTAAADSGIDTVDYSQALKGMTVTLGDGNAQGTATSADQGTDSLYGIENIIGSNLEKDIITGNSGVNTLSGLGGADTLYGGSR